MGLGNFIKRTAGIGKLPKDQINEFTIINILKKGATFIVALPSFQTVSAGVGESVSTYQGGIRTTFYTPAPKKRVQKRIVTNINYNNGQITIQHAQNNGAHIFINANSIAQIWKFNNGIKIELVNGVQYQFLMDKKIKNMWKGLGFNPQFVIDVFYNLIISGFQTSIKTPAQTVDYEDPIILTDEEIEEYKKKAREKEKQEKLKKHKFELAREKEKALNKQRSANIQAEYHLEIPCPACGKMIKDKALRCKYCKTNLKEYETTREYQEKIEELKKMQYINFIESKQEKGLKASNENDSEIETLTSELVTCLNCGEKYDINDSLECPYCKKNKNKSSNENNSEKVEFKENNENKEALKELFSEKNEKLTDNNQNNEDKEALKELFGEKSEKLSKNSENIVEDKSPFEKIKEAKELLDIGAITQEEYDKIKEKYIAKF